MIRRIRGRLVHKEPDGVEVMTASGLGYELLVPTTLLNRLPEPGEDVELHAALVVRDDALELYGFATAGERELFRRLQTASGVGPRLALALLSQLASSRLVSAIRSKDHPVLQTVSGVGKKTAERIALELADKLDDLVVQGDEEGAPVTPAASAAVEALRALGYSLAESQKAVGRAVRELDGGPTEVEDLVRRALRRI